MTATTTTADTTIEAPAAPPVVVSIPAGLSSDGLEVLVRHEFGQVWVDVRPANSGLSWTPIRLVGGSFQVRAS